MKNNKTNVAELFEGLANITQLGLSVVIPIVGFALLADFLKNRYNIPDFLVIIIIIIGVLGGLNSFVMFVRSYLRRIDKEGK